MRAALVPAVVACGVLSLAGCAGHSAPKPTIDPTFTQLVDAYISQAVADDASEEQLATLRHAKQVGGVTYEEVAQAVDRSLQCIADAGFHVERYGTDDSRGFPMVDYFYEGPPTGNPVADACLREESEALEQLYQLQPSSVAAQNAHLAKVAPRLAECLHAAGVEVDFEGLRGDELGEAIHEAVNVQIEASNDGSSPALACFVMLSQ